MLASPQSDKEFLEQTAQWLAPDNAALADALPAVYRQLRELANMHLSHERRDHTLQPTALVHEAYLRLRGQRNVDWNNQAQFLGVAARMMRRILVNYAVARHAQKRGGGATHLELDTALAVFEREAIPALDVDKALTQLQTVDARAAQIAELRFFGGLTVPQTAEVLGISPATVKREWTVAKMFLERELRAQSE